MPSPRARSAVSCARRGMMAGLAVCVLAASCTSGSGLEAAEARSVEDMASALGADVVEALARGYVPGRSGEIALVPEPWSVLGQWRGGVRGADDPRTTHATPWAYHQHVPIFLYGPGRIREGVRSARPVTVADLAPTLEVLLGMERAPGGSPLEEALVHGRRSGPPRAIVVVVADGVGWNVLEEWPGSWRVQRDLASRGTAYLGATVGSAPSVTAPIHANIGTGNFPREHLMTENTARLPDGTIGDMFFDRGDPALMDGDTTADRWDREQGNLPWVGMVGYESWHLPMMGRGARARGGDRDVAVLWDRERHVPWTNERFYDLPSHVPGRKELDEHLRRLDREDGALDDTWDGVPLGNEFFHAGLPAFVRYQGDVVRSLIEGEPFGRDDLTDLLFVELKSADLAGHLWNMAHPRQGAVLRAQDEVLRDLVRLLDRRVGAGEYVLAMTADHGQTPNPATTGGLRIDRFRLGAVVNDHFGAPVVEDVHPSEMYLDEEVMEAAGVTVEEIAEFVGTYRYRDGIPQGTHETIDAGRLDERVFAAALPGDYLAALNEEEMAALGPGRYPEGNLRTAPPASAALLDG